MRVEMLDLAVYPAKGQGYLNGIAVWDRGLPESFEGKTSQMSFSLVEIGGEPVAPLFNGGDVEVFCYVHGST